MMRWILFLLTFQIVFWGSLQIRPRITSTTHLPELQQEIFVFTALAKKTNSDSADQWQSQLSFVHSDSISLDRVEHAGLQLRQPILRLPSLHTPSVQARAPPQALFA